MGEVASVVAVAVERKQAEVPVRVQTALVTAKYFLLFYLAGLITLILSASVYTSPAKAVSSAGIAIMVAFAASFAGGLIGFLFGIPRSGSRSTPAQNDLLGIKVQRSPNTNLEEISDWLTKVIVGVGLTQVPSIVDHTQKIVSFVASGMLLDLGAASSHVLAGATLVYFSILGFIYVWMSTRLYLSAAMSMWDQLAEAVTTAVKTEVSEHLPEISTKISSQLSDQLSGEIDKKISEERKVENLVTDYLEPGADLGPLSAEAESAILSAIQNAPDTTKARIFYRARTVRYGIYKSKETDSLAQCKLDRVIKVFQTLVKCDVNSRFHRNHAQLAYAYKLKERWEDAISEFNSAIKIRDQEETATAYLLYEFNRAECYIKAHAQLSADETAKVISDFKKAAEVESLKAAIRNEHPSFAKFLDS